MPPNPLQSDPQRGRVVHSAQLSLLFCWASASRTAWLLPFNIHAFSSREKGKAVKNRNLGAEGSSISGNYSHRF